MFRCIALFLIFLSIQFSGAREIAKLEDSLRVLFPNAQIELKKTSLSPEQIKKIEELSGIPFNLRSVSWYVAKSGNMVLGYAYVDTHKVRTKTGTVLYAINQEGKLLAVEVLAFNEPLEYLPEKSWLRNFEGKRLGKDQLRFKKDVPNITGATITARAITDNTRKVLAMWQVLFGEGK